MKQINNRPLSIITLLFHILGYTASSHSADVPANVTLADKQVLVRTNGSEPQTLDPTLQQGSVGAAISLDLFEGLTIAGSNGQSLPGVATHWQANKSHTTYTFYLRKNAKWSNGEPVTAEDFVYSWRRLVDPATAANYAYFAVLAGISNAEAITQGKAAVNTLGVKAINAHQLKVFLNKPVPFFVVMTAHSSLSPLYAPIINKWGNQWTKSKHIVSNGAYQLSKHVVNDEIVLKRNPQYWNNKKTVIESVKILPIESATTEMNRFKAGGLDMTLTLPGEYFKTLQREIPESVRITPFLATYHYDININKPPLNNAKLRKALAYAIDREVITRYIKQTGELPAYTLTPPSTNVKTDFVPAWATWTQAERNLKAKQLLEASGLNPKAITLTLSYNTDDNHKKIATAIQQMWKTTLGIQVKIENQEWKTFITERNTGNFDIARDGWFGDYNEASTFLSLGISTNPNNSPRFNSPAFDDTMQAAAKAPTLEARKVYYAKASEILSEEMPFIPIYSYVMARLVKPYIGGYNPTLLDYKYTKDMYIIKH